MRLTEQSTLGVLVNGRRLLDGYFQLGDEQYYKDYSDAIDKLAAYEDAEEQGLLVHLPCKVGDMVYSPRKNGILEQQVDYICMEKGEIYICVSFRCNCDCAGCPHNDWHTTFEGEHYCNGEYGNGVFVVNDFGKTVFLTREETEAALKKEKENVG